MKVLAPGVVALFALVACVDKQNIATPAPTAKMADVSGKSLTALEQGHEIYRSQCVACHENRLPSSATLPEYHKKVSVMATRAGLDKSQEAALQLYLDEFSDR
ncbi:hypothetical protein V2O64_06985 [Verrucomicrobiaceae bacterium 227]